VNSYVLIRRLRGPIILLLIGGLALLHQMGVIGHFWHLFWPLLLILVGLMLLAERFALSTMDGTMPGPGGPPAGDPYPNAPYPNAPYQGAPYSAAPYANTPYPNTPYPNTPYPAPGPIVTPPPSSTSIVPADSHEFGLDISKDRNNGGQS
jgi:hypothetical protein